MSQDNDPLNPLNNVVAFGGGPVVAGVKVTNQLCVKYLEHLLEAARAGEVIGVAVVMLRFDATADFEMAGVLGGYEMIGAVRCLEHNMIEQEFSNGEELA